MRQFILLLLFKLISLTGAFIIVTLLSALFQADGRFSAGFLLLGTVEIVFGHAHIYLIWVGLFVLFLRLAPSLKQQNGVLFLLILVLNIFEYYLNSADLNRAMTWFLQTGELNSSLISPGDYAGLAVGALIFFWLNRRQIDI